MRLLAPLLVGIAALAPGAPGPDRPTPAPDAAPPSPPVERVDTPSAGGARRLHDYLTRLESLGFSGAAAVEHGGEVVLREGYGLADREARRPYDPDAVQTHGSITKQMTAAAILLLEERGRLSVDDPIAEHLDGVPPDKRTITLHHLLTHSAGLPGSIGPDREPVGADAFVERAVDTPLDFEPGTGYGYSNVGYALLGIVVERTAGVSYERFLREELLLPAGLAETGYLLPDWDEERLTVGYLDGERWGRVFRRSWRDDGPGWHLRANGGLHTTVDDMHRWLSVLKGDGPLPARAVERWTTGYVDEGGGDSRYAYGWAIHDTERGRMVAHNGGNGIFSADFVWIPDAEFFLYIQGNTSVVPAARLRESLLAAFFDPSFEMPPEVVEGDDADPADAAERAGAYGSEAGTLELTADHVRLLAAASGQAVLDALLGHDPEQRERFARLNERAMEAMRRLRAGREDAFRGMVGPDEDAEARARSMLGVFEDRGEPDSLTLVGSVANAPGTRFAPYGPWTTFVRADFADGASIFSVLWREDGTYRGTGIGPPSDVPTFVLVPAGEDRYAGIERGPPWREATFRFEGSCVAVGALRLCR